MKNFPWKAMFFIGFVSLLFIVVMFFAISFSQGSLIASDWSDVAKNVFTGCFVGCAAVSFACALVIVLDEY